MEHILYQATCIPTGKYYIGRTSVPLHRRMYSHFWKARYERRTTQFHNDLATYGEDGFRFEVIAAFDDYEALLREERRRIIEMRPSYNAVSAGNGGRPRPDLSVSLPGETWLPIPGYEDRYEVSDQGRIRGLPITFRNVLSGGFSIRRRRILKPSPHYISGHLHLILQMNGVKRNHTVHQLVASAFLGPCPKGLNVLHKNDDKANNTPSNLYHGTSKQNGRDRVLNGVSVRGAQHHAVSLTENMVREIFSLRGKMKQINIARKIGTTVSAVSHIHHGWSWTHVTGLPTRRAPELKE